MATADALQDQPLDPFEDVIRHARVLSWLPGLGADGALTPDWTAWLMSMDEVLHRAEIAARDVSVDLSLAFRGVREDLNGAVTGGPASFHLDIETTEVVTIRAAQLAKRAGQ
jgi:hypothetical protein